MLELRRVTKRYQTGGVPFVAVRGVSLRIDAGEYVAIMGPSGSGKSTLLHLLGLLDVPTEGEVWLAGQPTRHLSDKEFARLRNEKIGFVFQNFQLLPRTAAIENIALPLLYGRHRKARPEVLAARALQRVGLDLSKAWNWPNQLSGGQQQRVAIARAIVTDPEVVLADEPTGNLDSRSTEEILGLFQSLNDQGVTVVMVTHEPYVAQHAKRIVQIRDGRVERDEPVHERVIAAPVSAAAEFLAHGVEVSG
ncbi:MAG: ABC transporter ATP-binding protein [Alicyclobacillaceae bacterium]|nr:ABC transporter ATP-binding protein [Alicyclobacillaceae bacterium]